MISIAHFTEGWTCPGSSPRRPEYPDFSDFEAAIDTIDLRGVVEGVSFLNPTALLSELVDVGAGVIFAFALDASVEME